MKRLTALTLLFLFANLPCIAKPERFVRTGHATSITSIAFSPDGKTIASGSFDGTVKLWDLASRKEVGSLQTGRVMSLAWKEQHRLLVGFSNVPFKNGIQTYSDETEGFDDHPYVPVQEEELYTRGEVQVNRLKEHG